LTRARFIRLLAAAGLTGLAAAQETKRFPPWQRGFLDIHHIATGRGSSTLLLLPDAQTIMIDAGASQDSLQVSAPPKPDASRTPGQWIARYAARHMKPAGRTELDYFLVSHIHPDHIDGLMDVDALLPIRKLIDRGYPSYDNPAPLDAPFAANYLKYVRSRKNVERFQVGSASQLPLIRNIAANGEVWTRKRHFADVPNENMCSAAIRLNYGKFSYYTGGDLTCSTNDGASPWRDIETPVAEVTGPVDVAVANHHGYYDAVGPAFVRALRPKVFIIPTWHISHPNTEQLERMQRQSREIYATNLTEISKLLNARLLPGVASTEGHVVVRVHPGGDTFEVMVLDNSDESDTVMLTSTLFRAG
jgi:beta-lactamase superfamily II metal-dependent hydrolase